MLQNLSLADNFVTDSYIASWITPANMPQLITLDLSTFWFIQLEIISLIKALTFLSGTTSRNYQTSVSPKIENLPPVTCFICQKSKLLNGLALIYLKTQSIKPV